MGREETRLTRHPEAEDELLRAVRWYEERVPGLGRGFLDAVRETTARIGRHPAIGTKLPGRLGELNVRRSLVTGFPYVVVYREIQGSIQIVAVAHQRRRPRYWLERVPEADEE